MEVPFIDLKRKFAQFKDEADRRYREIMDQTAFISGENVKEFEQAWAEYLGVKQAIAVNSGTSAIYLLLRAIDLKAGDEVIVPANTFIATAEAVSMIGATPVFVDVTADTYLIDPQKVSQAISERTKAVIAVQLYGQSADMAELKNICQKNKLYLIEDACQAHGSDYQNRKVGSWGEAAGFSFYPSKNLGGFGESGMVATSDESMAAAIRLMSDHGSINKYYHEVSGGNFRMSEFQAAVLNAKLPYLDEWNNQRCQAAKWYQAGLDGLDLVLPVEAKDCRHVYYIYVIRAKARDALREFLAKNGVSTGIHYPVPLHLQKCYQDLGYQKGDLPIAEKAAAEIISLPIFPGITREEVDYVCRTIKQFFNQSND